MDVELRQMRVAVGMATGSQATVKLANFVPVRQTKVTLCDVACPLAFKTRAADIADHCIRVTTTSVLIVNHLRFNSE